MGCLVLQKYDKGFQANLFHWEGEQETGRGNGQMRLLFTFGTQSKRRRWRRQRGLLALLRRLFTVDPIGRIKYTQCVSVAAFLLILAGQSDVHLKLSIIPNCMFPVMIVQVVQIVYFYFGVLN